LDYRYISSDKINSYFCETGAGKHTLVPVFLIAKPVCFSFLLPSVPLHTLNPVIMLRARHPAAPRPNWFDLP
jgi:hypothetical protein